MLVVATNIRIPGTHGGSTHVSELVAALRAHGPTMLLARAGSRGQDVLGVGVLRRTAPAGLRHPAALLHALRALPGVLSFRPDVIYERGSAYGAGAMLSLALDIPMIGMVLDEHISPLTLSRASRLIATDTDLIPRRYRDKAARVSWGANVERFHPGVSGAAVRARYGLEGCFVVGYSGTFRAWHGLPALVGAAAHLRDTPHVRFLLAGDGPDRPDVEARIAAAGLRDRFVLAGRVPYEEMPSYLAAMDVVVAPFDPDRHPLSKKRGFTLDPLKVFESVSAARPTITVGSRNLRAIFGEDGACVRYVEPRDPGGLARAIEAVIRAPDEARVMAARGSEKVARDHTWAAHAEQLAGLFREVLARGR